ncbi:LPS assembly lipoprotein LptE [Parvibaculaceae bacterium PLY_AMNH_Bact1]|nr:LPS assembly lipoprotein LptE [Parvibaculaceae bacterium PLY_AMNH_Bact1]
MSLLVSACGFTPLYAPHGQDIGIVSTLASIAVQAPNDSVNRALRISLEDKLHANGLAAPQYTLVLTSALTKSDVALQQDTEVTRSNLTLRTTFNLQNLETGETEYQAKAFGIVAYNRVTSEFANIIAERDAEARVANQVAQEIHTKLAIYFERLTSQQGAS